MRNIIFSSLFLLAACAGNTVPQTSQVKNDETESTADKAAWIEKTAAALRNGEGIGPNDDMNALMAKSKDDIVKTFMADPRFGDTVLAMNLFYLGRGVNELHKADNSYDPMVFAMPQALAAARAVVDGGDFYEIYAAKPSMMIAPLKAVDEPTRTAAMNEIMKGFDGTIAAMGADGALDKNAGCNTFYNVSYNVGYKLTLAGYDSRFGDLVTESWIQPMQAYPNGDCYNQTTSAEDVKKKFITMRDGVKALFDKIPSLPTGAAPKSLKDLAKMDFQAPGLPSLSKPLTSMGFWSILKNSSTNYNRKRSAYMLRTYFCDDLTPLAIEFAGPHAEGSHATDPACQACHYKLDPMGGLFRNIGQNGQDYSGSNQYTFDDFKQLNELDYANYLKGWKSADDKWQVGYYVAAGKAHKKWKGETLEDMWAFLPQAPEAKACLVRRMAEFFLGPDQVYDGAWLEQISTNLKPGPTSAQGVKSVISSLVTSKTFANQNPDFGTCYDFSTDVLQTGERAPCEIASIVSKSCEACHSDTDEDNRLDLTQWVKLADGTHTFKHLGANGQQLSKKDSYKIIMDRLVSGDTQKRMPKGGSMPDTARQVLYKWLDKNGGQ